MTASSDQTSPVDHRYDAALADRIEGKWQRRWAEEKTFSAPNPVGDLAVGAGPDAAARADRSERDHVYLMDMLPTRPAGDCTSATPWGTSPPTSTPGTTACAATT